MKLQEVIEVLESLDEVNFILPNGQFVPKHFHVTEVGKIDKNFIDCGGVVRHESVVNFQLWQADDYDHRLAPQKLKAIIQLSIDKLGLQNDEIEVEYQGETIGKYGLSFEAGSFLLVSKQTDCLAKDNCGIPAEKPKVRLSSLGKNTCEPNSGCC